MRGGALSATQYGFRRGSSAFGSLRKLTEATMVTQHLRPVLLLATLNVKNAFKSLRWSDVLNVLEYNYDQELGKIHGNKAGSQTNIFYQVQYSANKAQKIVG